MMAENDITKYAKGFRFHPFDRELINDYLKPKIMGKQLPCNMIKNKELYGPSSNPWCVFDTNDRDSWFRCPGLKKTEMCMFVFVKLCKLSRSNSSTSKNTSKKAGCGTWVGKGKQDQIVDCKGNLIGEKRYLVFEVNDIDSVEDGLDLSKVGQYKMHEYSLSGINAGLNSAGITVLCRITYDSSKECPLNLKPGMKSTNHVSRSREAQIKEENNTNNFEGTGIVTAENLTVLNCGVSVGENLEERRTLTSKSMVVTYSDASDPYAASQCNNGLTKLDDFGGGFRFGDLGGDALFLDDLDDCNKKWFMACLDPNVQEEPSRDSSSMNLEIKFEYEENLYQPKKMCLDNPN